MLQKFFSIFKSKNTVASLADVEAMSSLIALQTLLDDSVDSDSEKELVDAASDNDVLNFLNEIFDTVHSKLESTTHHVELANKWEMVLREILVGVQYRGKYVEVANKIKEKLDKKRNLNQCSDQTKNLLIEYSNSLCEDQEEIQQYLVNVASKLQEIYSEISEARSQFLTRESKKQSIENSFEQGIQDISQTIQASENLDTLKSGLNAIVKAIETKVIEEVESEENETKILESKIAGMSDKIKSLEDHAQNLEKEVREKHMAAITDPLTGLLNRAAYVQALEKSWMSWESNNTPSTILVWDIDHFKMINDRHGHAAGDKVLQSVASKLKSGASKEDIIARFGGEEFVMLLTNKTLEEGMRLAENIRELISNTDFTYKNVSLQVTISCGVASFVTEDTPTTLFDRADKALYQAKRSGRDRVESLKVA